MTDNTTRKIRTGRSRAWCFTLHNYTAEDEQKLKNYPCEYMLYGYETTQAGIPHLQGFFYCSTQRALTAIKKRTSPTIHLENANDIPASIAYCKKGGNFFEQGEPPRQGRRTDLEGIQRLIDEGADMLAVAQSNFTLFTLYYRAFERYRNLLLRGRNPQDDPPAVYWLYGPAGSGKTRHVFDLFPPEDIYVKPPGQWWDGYTQQRVVILDDFDPSHMCLRNLLHLLDRYPLSVPVKGSFVNFNSPIIYITCDRHPSELYNQREFSQILRRLTAIVPFPRSPRDSADTMPFCPSASPSRSDGDDDE